MKVTALVVVVAAFLVGCDNWSTSPRTAYPDASLSASMSAPRGGGPPAQEVTAGELFSCALNARGEAFCWGINQFGTLGTGDRQDATTPRRVVGDVAFASFSSAGSHVCALARGGEAWCWGGNAFGELGTQPSGLCAITPTSQLPCSLVPVAVSGDLRFHSLDAGFRHNCGLTADGTAYCWGWNQFGQLGTTTTEICSQGVAPVACSRTPVPVDGGLRFRAISAGFWQTCGLTFDEQTFCWGNNVLGAYGNGTTTGNSATPVPGASGVPLRVVSTGSSATCGITSDRITMCWGTPNSAGELGDGTNTRHLTPQPIAGDFVNVRSVSTLTENNFLAHVCGIGTQGELQCWGSNRRGQLGATTTQICIFATIVFDCSNVPVSVSGDNRFQAVAAGFEHTCGVTKNGDVLCWGRNDRGQIGDGSTTDRPTPVVVALP